MTSILDKISWARGLYLRFGRDLGEDSRFASLFYRYRESIKTSRQVMDQCGLGHMCAHCATEIPGGGCCGEGIDDWYDELLLLFNLLMEIDLPRERLREEECLFLGPKGCLLSARHHFCVNYLCHRIRGSLFPGLLTRLEAQSGKELFLCWQLEGEARRILSRLTGRDPYLLPSEE